MTSNLLDYHFKCINPEDFEISLVYHAENRLMVTIFQKARSKLLRKKNIAVKGNPDVIDGFDVPAQYLKMLKTAIMPNVGAIIKEAKQDGIQVISWKISQAKFKRENEEWKIRITIEGIYGDKR